jgi:hypothetical protein
MKPTGITCVAALSLLFGTAAWAPCLLRLQGQENDPAKAEQRNQEKAESRQHLGQQPQRSKQAKQQQTRKSNQEQTFQKIDRPQSDRALQRQFPPDTSHNQPSTNRRQLDRGNQHSQYPRETRSQPEHDQAEQDRQHQSSQHEQWGEHSGEWQQRRAHDWQADHRTWEQRGGYRGYRIPDDRFDRYFGARHWFRMRGLPVLVVNGLPRFRYGGYWFSLVDPWPEYWKDDWYETDDVYIVYSGDGYYLFNRRYPAARIAISISM